MRVRCNPCTRSWRAVRGEQVGYDVFRTGAEQVRDGVVYREIWCRTCGATGWTKHNLAAKLRLREGEVKGE